MARWVNRQTDCKTYGQTGEQTNRKANGQALGGKNLALKDLTGRQREEWAEGGNVKAEK